MPGDERPSRGFRQHREKSAKKRMGGPFEQGGDSQPGWSEL